jgi:hypothetical protein
MVNEKEFVGKMITYKIIILPANYFVYFAGKNY